MSGRTGLGKIDRTVNSRRQLTAVRLLLPLGWALAAIGYYGPWISHSTAALTLSGVDMGEFVKFLPDVPDGSLVVIRQLFYLPPLATVVSVALLTGSRRLAYPWFVRAVILLLALPVSLQLLPPAWSPASLVTAEFRLQTVALVVAWVLLATFWLWGRLPSWLTGTLAAVLLLVALVLSAWQMMLVKPAIDQVYHLAPSAGWGFFLCMAGLGITVAACILFVVRSRTRVGTL